ncbi:GntR family transcriptional regulator [Streptomyces sp. NBC_01727]|uniref:GntR family transcriptional regulator n=1 Tax=unclassified Streptomyces TaxID=2593676 RepID=UPI002E115B65|nr:GntR family transcriptional regulator [Streptomyces sp. NBC_01727]
MNGSRKPSPDEVAEALRVRIRTGDLKSGDQLPTQAVLAEEFGVERGVVRLALQRLQGDGLLTGVTRGAPPRVASPAAVEVPQQTAAGLGPRILGAFQDDAVRIDALCLTAESLTLALSEPLQRIRAGKPAPRSVKVRVMLPARDLDLAFPRRAKPLQDDGAVHQRWLALRNSQGQVLKHNLESLRSTHDLDVEVTMRALPFTPPVKLYLLNGTEALFAYYTVEKREELIEGSPTELFDVLGSDSTLFRFEVTAGVRDQLFVAQSAAWFESLWNTIATELVLGT